MYLWFSKLSSMASLTGKKVIVLLACATIGGVLLGFFEVILASTLFLIFSYFGLLINVPTISWIPHDTSPLLLVLTAATATTSLRIANNIFPTMANNAMGNRIRTAALTYGLSGSRERTSLSVADITRILFQVSDRTAAFVHSLTGGLTNLFMIMITTFSMIIISPALSILVAIAGALVAFSIYALRVIYSEHAQASHNDIKRLNHSVAKSTRNLSLLRMMGVNDRELAKLLELSNKIINNSNKNTTISSIHGNSPYFFGILIIIFILFINKNYLHLGSSLLISFVYLLNRSMSCSSNIVMMFAQSRENYPYFQESISLMPVLLSLPESEKNGSIRLPTRPTNLIVDDLSIGRDSTLISNIEFSATCGDMILITGESGRGKTTLMSTLVGVVDKLTGSVRWDGLEIDTLDLALLRSYISYAGPEPYLIEGTIAENLLFGLANDHLDENEMWSALSCTCADFIRDLPEGLNHRLSENGDGISAGQKQRIALARCLLKHPRILLLDEATANINEEIEGTIIEGIRKSYPDTIIIAVSHRSSMRRYATSVVHL